jgi:hypothetical protein
LKGADGGESKDCADANGAERRDVCAPGNFCRVEFVVGSVAGEESDWCTGRSAEDIDRRRRGAPRGCDIEESDVGEAIVGESFNPGTTNDSDADRVCQVS